MRIKLSEAFPDHRNHIFEPKNQANCFLDSKRTTK